METRRRSDLQGLQEDNRGMSRGINAPFDFLMHRFVALLLLELFLARLSSRLGLAPTPNRDNVL